MQFHANFSTFQKSNKLNYFSCSSCKEFRCSPEYAPYPRKAQGIHKGGQFEEWKIHFLVKVFRAKLFSEPLGLFHKSLVLLVVVLNFSGAFKNDAISHGVVVSCAKKSKINVFSSLVAKNWGKEKSIWQQQTSWEKMGFQALAFYSKKKVALYRFFTLKKLFNEKLFTLDIFPTLLWCLVTRLESKWKVTLVWLALKRTMLVQCGSDYKALGHPA